MAAGSQAALVDKLVRRLRDDPLGGIVVVVPSWFAAVQLRRRLAQHPGGPAAHVGVRVLTPEALVHQLGGLRAAELGLSPLPPWGLELLAVRAAQKTATFAQAASQPGFAGLAASTLRRLRLWGVCAGRLRSKAQQAEGAQERQRWQDLAELYEEVEQALVPAGSAASGETMPGRWVDLAALASLAAELAAAGRAADVLGGQELWLWGVRGALEGSRAWRRLVRELARGGVRVRAFHADPDTPERGPAACQFLQVRACPSGLEEARAAVEFLLKAAGDGTGWWQLAVLVPRDRAYSRWLAHLLGSAGVPAHMGALAAGPPGPATRAVAGWLRLWRDGVRRAALMDWLQTAPLRPQWAGLEPSRWQPARWEMLSLRAGLVGEPSLWPQRLQRYAQTVSDEEERQAVGALAAVVERVVQELAELAPGKGWEGLSEAVERWMARALEPAQDSPLVLHCLRQLQELEELERQHARQGGQAAGGVEAGLFAEAFEALLDAEAAARGLRDGPGFEQGCVAVLPLELARGCAFDGVVVLGAVQQHYPGSLPSGLVAPEELEELAGLPPGQLRAGWLRQRRAAFFWAVRQAGRRVLVLHPRWDLAAARELLPSPWLAELPAAGTAPDGPMAGTSGDGQAFWQLPDLASLYVEIARRYGQQSQPWLALRFPQAQQGAKARRARQGPRPSEFEGCGVPFARPARDEGERSSFSPTELEEYARCPRRFFFHRVLGVEVDPEPESTGGLVGALRGQVVHEVLRRFYQELEPGTLLEPGWPRRLEAAARAAVEELAPGLLQAWPQAQAQLQVLVRRLQALVALTDLEPPPGRLVRRWLEYGFGELTLEGSDGPAVALRGRMDRVELWERPEGLWLRVVDYKTGRPQAGAADDLEAGLRLQPAVYLAAACRMAGVAPAAAEVEFVYVDSPTLPVRVRLEGSAWHRLEQPLRRTLAVLLQGLTGGYFAPDPHPSVRCEDCPFYVLCGPQARRFPQRVEEPPFPGLVELRGLGP